MYAIDHREGGHSELHPITRMSKDLDPINDPINPAVINIAAINIGTTNTLAISSPRIQNLPLLLITQRQLKHSTTET